jgi:hypothetical protein
MATAVPILNAGNLVIRRQVHLTNLRRVATIACLAVEASRDLYAGSMELRIVASNLCSQSQELRDGTGQGHAGRNRK